MQIKNTKTDNIITMVNTGYGYSEWEKIVGNGRIIAAFPGAGGKIVDSILNYKLTSSIIQKTTFGDPLSEKKESIKELIAIMKKSRIKYSYCKNMDAWQKSHLAMVTVLANGIYMDGGDNYSTSKNKKAIKYMCLALKENYKALKKISIPITPIKMNIFRLCPSNILYLSLKIIYNTKFAETVISSHAIKAKDEMILLNNEFYNYLKQRGIELKYTHYIE